MSSHGGAPAYEVRPVGWVESALTDRSEAPKQPDEGAPPARIVFRREFAEALSGLQVGDRVVLLTWLHLGRRDVLTGHPRGDTGRVARGIFTTRSPERPNPIGLHTVTITGVESTVITVDALEAVTGTPVLDVKPLLGPVAER